MKIVPLAVSRRIKTTIAQALHRRGYEVRKIKTFDESSVPSAFEIQQRAVGRPDPVIFDVGANRGQTARRYREMFPRARIHAFEPVAEFFQSCRQALESDPGIILNNFALSDGDGSVVFHETLAGQSSSALIQTNVIPAFFSSGDFAEHKAYPVRTRSIDNYCDDQKVDRIDILKIDTEGYELTVLKGAKRMLAERRIGQVYLEVNFQRFWEECALYHHVATYLEAHELDLFAIYGLGTGALGASRSGDALFMSDLDKKSLLSGASNAKGQT